MDFGRYPQPEQLRGATEPQGVKIMEIKKPPIYLGDITGDSWILRTCYINDFLWELLISAWVVIQLVIKQGLENQSTGNPLFKNHWRRWRPTGSPQLLVWRVGSQESAWKKPRCKYRAKILCFSCVLPKSGPFSAYHVGRFSNWGTLKINR